MTYYIDYKTSTGKAFADYLARRKSADEATDAFVKSLAGHPDFHLPTSADTDYICKEGCDGGIECIVLKDGCDMSGINSLLWAHAIDEESNETLWVPRVRAIRHFFTYGQAMALYRQQQKQPGHNQQWLFSDLDATGKEVVPTKYRVQNVFALMLPEDIQAATRTGDKMPKPQTAVAEVTKFEVIPAQEGETVIIPANYTETDTFALAKKLSGLFYGLPCVRHKELLDLLGLSMTEKENDKEIGLNWKDDAANQRYIVQTTLKSNNQDLVEQK